jgi:hypothetical protein
VFANGDNPLLNARCVTSRHTPHGYRTTTYTAEQIDAIAAYAPDTDRCYLIPIDEVESRTVLNLRVAPTRNNQTQLVRWAKDYELDSAIERYWGTRPTLPGLNAESVTEAIE